VAVGFGVQVVAHFDEQGDVLIGAEASIQAHLRFNRFGVGGIVLLKPKQTLLQEGEFGLLVAQLRRCLGQTALDLLAERAARGQPFEAGLQMLAHLGQPTGWALCPAATLVVLLQIIHLLLLLLHLLLGLC
jgi:hypothetical protein